MSYAILILLLLFSWTRTNKIITVRESNTRDSIINSYNTKIKVWEKSNKTLMLNQVVLEKKIDSLEHIKSQVIINYGKEIKTIHDATAAEHAIWLQSTIQKLDSAESK